MKIRLDYYWIILLSMVGHLASASDVVVPRSYDKIISGTKSLEALRQTFLLENLERVFHAFYLGNGSVSWGLQEMHRSEKSIQFKMNLKNESSLEGVYPPPSTSAAGWYQYFSGAISYASSYVSHWVVGELHGELTLRKAECSEPFEKAGYEIDFDFNGSSYLLYSLLEKMKVKVCLKEHPDQTSTWMRLETRVNPGIHFPGFESELALRTVTEHEEALANAITEVAALIDAGLVQAELENLSE